MRRVIFRVLGRLLGLSLPMNVPTEEEIEAMILRYYPPEPLEGARPAANTEEI